ncbi:hypothetical protein HN51_062696, partial [Arachis hypogaea]
TINLVAICTPADYNTCPFDTIYSNFIDALPVVKYYSENNKRLIHFSTVPLFWTAENFRIQLATLHLKTPSEVSDSLEHSILNWKDSAGNTILHIATLNDNNQIDTCNAFYCEGFTPNKNYKPKMWTENWTGWYTGFGGTTLIRPAKDIAFSIARFILNRARLLITV